MTQLSHGVVYIEKKEVVDLNAASEGAGWRAPLVPVPIVGIEYEWHTGGAFEAL